MKEQPILTSGLIVHTETHNALKDRIKMVTLSWGKTAATNIISDVTAIIREPYLLKLFV